MGLNLPKYVLAPVRTNSTFNASSIGNRRGYSKHRNGSFCWYPLDGSLYAILQLDGIFDACIPTQKILSQRRGQNHRDSKNNRRNCWFLFSCTNHCSSEEAVLVWTVVAQISGIKKILLVFEWSKYLLPIKKWKIIDASIQIDSCVTIQSNAFQLLLVIYLKFKPSLNILWNDRL